MWRNLHVRELGRGLFTIDKFWKVFVKFIDIKLMDFTSLDQEWAVMRYVKLRQKLAAHFTYEHTERRI